MEREFVSSVSRALDLVRKHDLLGLGKHELARSTVVQRRVSPGDTPIQAGRILGEILRNLLESRMKPEEPKSLDRADWRRYIVLRDYVFRGKRWGEVCNNLAISQSLFFRLKSEAIELLANEFWMEEQKAEEEILRVPNNIPPASFDFIPRADEEGRDLVEVVVEGFQRRPWIVSIRGFPGAGKTTLAIEAAWAAIKQGLFDQVIWVTIGRPPLTLDELLGSIFDTIGKELGSRRILALESLREKRDLVLELLGHIKCLLVIDNTEVVPGEQHEAIIDFIRGLTLPTCVLLVSREMRRKTELETTVPVSGMREGEALEFLRARSEEHHIQLDREQALDLYKGASGNPVALLWALGMMTKYGLRTEDVFKVEIPTMFELLRSLLGEVYEKLDLEEEKVLNVMPLFSVPVSWRAIAAASGLIEDPTQLKVALGSLYSRFLVNRDQDQRYSILPLTRMFLEDKADIPRIKPGEQPLTEFRAEAYRRLADYYFEELEKSDPYARLKYVRDQRENILRVMEWCHDHDDFKRVTDLMFLVGGVLGDLGYWRDRLVWGQRAVKASEKIGNLRRVVWHNIYDVGWTHIRRGEYDKGEEVTLRGLSRAQELHYAEAQAVALRNLGIIAFDQEDYEKAEENIERGLHIAEAEGMTEWVAFSRSSLGLVKLELGEVSEARRLFEKGYAVWHSLGNPSAEADSLAALALAVFKEGHVDRAVNLLDKSLSIARGIPQPAGAYAFALRARGIIFQEQGRFDEAKEFFEQSLELYSKLGSISEARELERLLERLSEAYKEPSTKPEDRRAMEKRGEFIVLELNPYIAGPALRTGEMFFGREDVFQYIKKNLKGRYQDNIIVLYGQRKMGKTSALYQLPSRLGEEHIPVFVDMERITRGTDYFFYTIAFCIYESLERHGIFVDEPNREAFRGEPESYFENHYLREVRRHIGDKHLVLIIDEFEVIEENIERDVLDPGILNYLRHLMQHGPNLDFIFTGTHRIEELVGDYWSIFFNLALYKKISFLDERATEQLITEPVRGYFTYAPSAVTRIQKLAGAHPYFTQLLCHKLVGYRNEKRLNRVNVRHVDDVIQKVIEEGGVNISYIWRGSSLKEKLLLVALNEIIRLKGTASTGDVERFLQQKNITLNIPGVIKNLEVRDVIVERDGRCEFAVDLFRYWIDENYNLERTLMEASRDERESLLSP